MDACDWCICTWGYSSSTFEQWLVICLIVWAIALDWFWSHRYWPKTHLVDYLVCGTETEDTHPGGPKWQPVQPICRAGWDCYPWWQLLLHHFSHWLWLWTPDVGGAVSNPEIIPGLGTALHFTIHKGPIISTSKSKWHIRSTLLSQPLSYAFLLFFCSND